MKRVLHIEHDWGGGLTRHVRDLASFLQRDGIGSVRCRPHQASWLDIEVVEDCHLHEPIRLFADDVEASVATIRDLGIVHAHFHSIISYSSFVVDQLLRILRQARLQYDCTVHDYAAICPRVHMVDHGQVYCDVAALWYCSRCVAKAGTPFGDVDPAAWRARHWKILQGARSIFVPNADVADRLWFYLGDELRLRVKPHPEPISSVLSQPVRHLPIAGQPRRVAVIGRLADIKGLNVVRAMALDAARRDLPIQFVIFGEPDAGDLKFFSNVEVKGSFEEGDIDALIQSGPLDLAFFPSVCPETHLYVLSIAIRNLLFPVVFDIGAQAERVRRDKLGAVVPLSMALMPDRLNDQLLAMDIPPASAQEIDARRPIAAWSNAREYYELAWL